MQTTDSDIELILPNEQHRQDVVDYKNEFEQNDEMLHGGGGLHDAVNFDEWLDLVVASRSPETVAEGRVPASTYLAYRTSDGRLVGVIDCRDELNDYLLAQGGHIGYSVRKSERRKGYATEMLVKALGLYREKGIDKVLVTCDKDNEGSAKVIISCGGVLENEIAADDGKVVQRYWILL